MTVGKRRSICEHLVDNEVNVQTWQKDVLWLQNSFYSECSNGDFFACFGSLTKFENAALK